MARSRFVPPYTDTLTLANGDALIVRRRLTYGEQADSYEACCRNVEQPDGTILSVPQPVLLPRAKVAAYLVDWSFAGDDIPLRGMDLAQRIAVVVNGAVSAAPRTLDTVEPDSTETGKALDAVGAKAAGDVKA